MFNMIEKNKLMKENFQNDSFYENGIIKAYLHVVRNLVVAGLMLIMTILFCSCKNRVLEINTNESIYIPEAANAFAIEKETEVETVEPTEAHKPLAENFRMRPAREIVIGESQFMTRVRYIYNHVEDFNESHIVVEGMYGLYYSWDETFSSHMVYRNGPGDYGDDAYEGFYLNFDDVSIEEPITLNDWIRVRGTPYMYEHEDSEGEIERYLFLKVESLEILSTRERKAEMVND